jgi:hypothetical protein
MIQRPWERYCPDYIIEKNMPAEKNMRRLYCWAIVSHDFKSDLVWYDSRNLNGKMTI